MENKLNILFISNSKSFYDDRIYYHMTEILKKYYSIYILSSTTEKILNKNDDVKFISFEAKSILEKFKNIQNILPIIKPNIIICTSPILLIPSYYYKIKNSNCKLIYDITEWYPSKKELQKYSFRPLYLILYLIIHIFVSFLPNAFIFGEHYKSLPFKYLFFWKKNKTITYYPYKKYFPLNPFRNIERQLNLSYSGKISVEKGFLNFFNVIKSLKSRNPNLTLNIKIIGWYGNVKNETECSPYLNKLNDYATLQFHNKLNLFDYINTIKDTDIFLELRSDDFENQHSLPIKLFYYIALKRPIIFTDLKAIRKEVEFEQIGYLVKPENTDKICDLIENYIHDSKLYQTHCENANHSFQNKYNWNLIEDELVDFIKKF